jgi:hypothetical protein
MNLVTLNNGVRFEVSTWFCSRSVKSNGKDINLRYLQVGDQIDQETTDPEKPVVVEKVERF